MALNSEYHHQILVLVEWLRAQRNSTLEAWRSQVLEDNLEAVSTSLTRAQFIDHIPQVLETFEEVLLLEGKKEDRAHAKTEAASSDHGLHRWMQGYKLQELVREWGHLHKTVFEQLGRFEKENPECPNSVMTFARMTLANLSFEGVSSSCQQYFELHKAEVDGQVLDLEIALNSFKEIERQRAEAWREAAHDLRGSVNVVQSATSIIKREQDQLEDANKSKYYDILHSGVTSLRKLLVEVLDLARLEAGHEKRGIAKFDISQLMREIQEKYRAIAQERGLYFELEGPDSLIVNCDRVKVERIAQNLILNALNYTVSGGVSLCWGLNETKSPAHWSFSIKDTGPGILAGPGSPITAVLKEATKISQSTENPEKLETVRDINLPRKQRSGEGIGLSIVKRLCELLDATLELETEHQKGTTFRVIFPVIYS